MKKEKSSFTYINYILLFVVAGNLSIFNVDIYMISALGLIIYSIIRIVINNLKEDDKNNKMIIYIIPALIGILFTYYITYSLVNYVKGCHFTV